MTRLPEGLRVIAAGGEEAENARLQAGEVLGSERISCTEEERRREALREMGRAGFATQTAGPEGLLLKKTARKKLATSDVLEFWQPKAKRSTERRGVAGLVQGCSMADKAM